MAKHGQKKENKEKKDVREAKQDLRHEKQHGSDKDVREAKQDLRDEKHDVKKAKKHDKR